MISLFLLLAMAHAAKDACGTVNPNRCVEADFGSGSFPATPVDTSRFRQEDDPKATRSGPGVWKRSNGVIEEDSSIRGDTPSSTCPPASNFGTQLLLKRTQPILDKTFDRYIFSTLFAPRDADGTVGLVFAYKSAREHYRVAIRALDSCVSVQRRKDGEWRTLQNGFAKADIQLRRQYELRVRYGSYNVDVSIIDRTTRLAIASIQARALGDDLRAWQHLSVGLYSAANRQGPQFYNYLFADASAQDQLPQFLPAIVEIVPTAIPTTQALTTAVGQTLFPTVTPAPTVAGTQQPIPTQPPATKVDCVVSEWTAWSACSATCTGVTPAVATRGRVVLQRPANGGLACPALLLESQFCNEGVNCGPPSCNCVGCDMQQIPGTEAWCRCCYNAGRTDCGSNPRCASSTNIFGFEQCKTSGYCGTGANAKCGAELFPVRNFCNVDIDCVLSEWSSFGQCTKSCLDVEGGVPPNGQQRRFRSVVRAPVGKGTCTAPLEEFVPCNTTPCPIVCEFTEWSAFGECTRRCDGGLQSRSREVTGPAVARANPLLCFRSLTDVRECNTQGCPAAPVNCATGPFSPLSACTPFAGAPCGPGVRTRSAPIIVEARNGGVECAITDVFQTVGCEVPCTRMSVTSTSETSTSATSATSVSETSVAATSGPVSTTIPVAVTSTRSETVTVTAPSETTTSAVTQTSSPTTATTVLGTSTDGNMTSITTGGSTSSTVGTTSSGGNTTSSVTSTTTKKPSSTPATVDTRDAATSFALSVVCIMSSLAIMFL